MFHNDAHALPCHSIQLICTACQTFDSRMEQIRGEYFKEIRMMQAWSLFCFTILTARERIWRIQIQRVSVPKCYTECQNIIYSCRSVAGAARTGIEDLPDFGFPSVNVMLVVPKQCFLQRFCTSVTKDTGISRVFWFQMQKYCYSRRLRCRVRPHQGHKVSYAQAGFVLSFFRFFFPSLFFSFSSICLSFALSLLFFFCFFLSFFPSLLVVVVVVVPGQIF